MCTTVIPLAITSLICHYRLHFIMAITHEIAAVLLQIAFVMQLVDTVHTITVLQHHYLVT